MNNFGITNNEARAFMDSASGATFFSRQLDYVFGQAFNVLYADLKYATAFPVNTEVPEWAETYTYETFDRAGKAKIIGSDVNDLPRVDVAGKETTQKIQPLGALFSYTSFEVIRAQRTGISLETMRANTAMRSVEELINEIVWFGDADAGLQGFFDNSEIPTATAPNGAALAPQWSTKTPDEILTDVSTMGLRVWEDSDMVHTATDLAVTPANRSLLFNTRLTDTGKSIAQYLVENLDWLASTDNIVAYNELVGAGTAGVDVAFAYRKDPMVVQSLIPRMPSPEEPVKRLMGWDVPVIGVCGGLSVRYPGAFYMYEDV